MTFDEMRATLDAMINECIATSQKAEKVLDRVPTDDIIVSELHALNMHAPSAGF
jgi:hypothetical protein